MRHTHGTWVAWGSGTADREVADETGRVAVPPGEESYTLRRVWLDDADINGYYHGFANRALWPLCHMLIQHFEYRTEYWERYRTVNLRFAHAVADEAERCTGRVDGVDSGLSFRARRRVSARDAAVAVHSSVLAHSVSAAGHSPPASRRHARGRAPRLARQRSHGISDRPLRREFSRMRRPVHAGSARRSRATRRSPFAIASCRSAHFRSASTSTRSRAWRRRPTAARASKRCADDTPRASGSSAFASIASTTRKEFPSASARSKRCGPNRPSCASNSRSSSSARPVAHRSAGVQPARARSRRSRSCRINETFGTRRLDADRADQRERRFRSARRASIASAICVSSRRCRTE